KYGECILVSFGAINVLIDGSHEKDFAGRDGYISIPDQLRSIFKSDPPFDINLLVVTHGHADHVGCLPALIDANIIRCRWALVTDPKLGFGRPLPRFGRSSDLMSPRRRVLAAALREEDASDLSDPELQEFLDAAATVEERYTNMLAALREKETRVIRYQGGP